MFSENKFKMISIESLSPLSGGEETKCPMIIFSSLHYMILTICEASSMSREREVKQLMLQTGKNMKREIDFLSPKGNKKVTS
jgi:hypothetical protein